MIVDDNTRISLLIQNILIDNNVKYEFGIGEKILKCLNDYDSEMRVKKIPHPFIIWAEAQHLSKQSFFNWLKEFNGL